MTERFTSLILNSKVYTENQLHQLALNKLSVKSLKAWKKTLYQFILEWNSDNPSVKIKTSGSTGTPKWIDIPKEKMIKSALITGEFFNLQKGDKTLLCLSTDFIAGKMMVVRAFIFGLNLIPVKPSGNPLKNIDDEFDFVAMTPMQVYNILIEINGIQKLNRIKNLIIGGGELNFSLKQKIRKLNNNTYHTYGMTETITHVALKKLSGPDTDNYFKALKEIWFEKDKRGCLVVIAPHLSDKKFVTNDLIDLKNDKEFEFTGRYDNVINSGGIKISPEKIEQKLEPFVLQRFFIAGIPDEKFGERAVLIIEGTKSSLSDFEEIILKSGLSKYEIPKQIFYVDCFSETENGKIIRKETLNKAISKDFSG
ncbi:MAG: AMP-binding protein [Bacteroidetes bacterium]|nr:AMP-binding protein [Bacteroidota bacterium]